MTSALPPAARAASQTGFVDLVGTWFVLIHYKDDATANPDVDRWDERLWKFEMKGRRLSWTEYTILVFNSDAGRFGMLGRNSRSRVLQAWEPDASQLADIERGLPVNKRGSANKSLRGSVKRGFKSASAMRAVSAMTVSYQQTWSLDELGTLPIFTRDDILGSEASIASKNGKGLTSGRTQYTTLEIAEDGRTLSGRFTRDENRIGTFRMVRAGEPRGLKTDDRTPNEKLNDRAGMQLQAAVQGEAYQQFVIELENGEAPDIRERVGDAKLRKIWDKRSARVIQGDQVALMKLQEDLREAYVESIKTDMMKMMLAVDASVEDQLRAAGLEPDAERVEFVKKVQERLGESRIAELREEYGERVVNGDEKAIRKVQEIVEQAVSAVMQDEMFRRVDAGDPEAIRQLREPMRKKRDRRP